MGKVKFFLLAGGYGKRAQPLSFFKPKPLFPLHGKPLIGILLDQLKAWGLREGFVNLHYLAEPLHQYITEINQPSGSLNIRFFYEEILSGSRILREAAGYLSDDEFLLIINGDIFLEIPIKLMIAEIVKSGADGILLVRPNRERDPQYKVIVKKDDFFGGRKILGLSDTAAGELPLMYTGVALFKKSIIQSIEDTNFFDLLERNQFRIKLMIYEDLWLDIGDPVSYFLSNRAYKKFKGIDTQNSLSESIMISPDSELKDCIVWENTQILNRTLLTNCIITGNMSLNQVEFHNKIVGSDEMGKLQTGNLPLKKTHSKP